MTTPTTKEQLIARIETQKETALKHPECSVALMDLEIANIARAAMDAEPVAYADPQALINFKIDEGKITARTREWMWRRPGEDLIPLYAAPPVAIVDAEPVADVVAWHKEGEERTCDIRWRRFDVAPGPLFAVAQPVAVVPGELDYQGAKELFNYLMTEEETIATVNGWNAFRAAMLNGDKS